MNIKKTIATWIILAGLSGFSYAENYTSGLETKFEKKHSIDLVGDFSKKEIKSISKVMKAVGKNINRKDSGIEYFTIKNVNCHDEKLGNDEVGYAGAVTESETNTIFMSTAAINKIEFEGDILSGYKGLLSHEIGHLIYPRYSKEIDGKFWELNRTPGKSKITEGYITDYPLTRPFFARTNEDFADIFSYIINKKHYADRDKIVQEKIKFVRQKILK